MLELKWNLKWSQVKKLFVLIMIVSISISSTGIQAYAQTTSGNVEVNNDKIPGLTESGTSGTGARYVSINETSITVRAGREVKLTYLITPLNATEKTATWTSNDPTIATVNDAGVVTGQSEGITYITLASNSNTSIKDYCRVEVLAPEGQEPTPGIEVENITIDKTSAQIKPGKNIKLSCTISPKNATDQTMTWETSDAAIATVDPNGIVTGKKDGSVVISATSNSNNSKKEYCIVEVNKYAAGNDIAYMFMNQTSMTIKPGSEAKVSYYITPHNATDQTVSWTTSDASVASVDKDGNVTGKTEGTAIITATSNTDTSKTAYCRVKIQTAEEPENPGWITPGGSTVQTVYVELEKNSKTMKPGQAETLSYEITPGNAADKTLTWVTNNPSVATVDENGVVTAKSDGRAVIAVLSSSNFADTCLVDVQTSDEGEPNPPETNLPYIQLNETSVTLKAGREEILTYHITPMNANEAGGTWTVNDESIATIDQNGIVTGVSKGVTYVTLTSNQNSNAKKYCRVEVWTTDEENPVPGIEVNSIEMNTNSLQIKPEKTARLSYTIAPQKASDKTVTWETNDASVATVDENGMVTGKKEGNAVISVTSNSNNSKKDYCIVQVSNYTSGTDVAFLFLTQTSFTIKQGKEAKLSYMITPLNATDKTVSWTTSDASVATVDKDGVVTGKAAGTATITATSNSNANAKGECKVKVEASENPGWVTPGNTKIEATSVSLNKSSVAMKTGGQQKLTFKISPSNTTDQTIKWTSSNTKIATVNNGVITAKANGKATITAKTSNGKTASTTVTVTTDATKVSVKSNLTIAKGKQVTLKASITPSTVSNKTLTYKSSNAKIAKVNSKGVVTGVSKGTATITVTTANGKKVACKVTVAEVKFNTSSAVIQAGTSTTTVKVDKYPATDSAKSYKSSNTKVATVNSKGKITAKKAGKTTITVTMKSGATASCKVTVQKEKVSTKKLTLSAKSVTLKKGKSITVTVSRNPVTATEKITWTTSDKKVAVVKNGKITAKKAGKATITVRTSNGKKATCKVVVKK